MAKTFDIIMAGILTGLTGLTTAFLGIGGTVIGAVSSSMIHQTLSAVIKDPLENSTIKQIEYDVVYTIPLIIISGVVLLFIIGHFNVVIRQDFYFLEAISHRFLFRVIGIGLLVMGIFSFLKSSKIKKKYSRIILYIGLVLFIRGILDLLPHFVDDSIMRQFDIVLFSIIFIALIYVIIKILLECVDLYMSLGNKVIDTSKIGKDEASNKVKKVCYVSRNTPPCESSFTSNNKKINHIVNEYVEKE